LGFLPGDLAQKVDPYLRPLYDALYDLMGFDRVSKAFEKGNIEVAPLAFMRGRTLNHAFVILDEAQNTTPEQMKMFLTRIGFGSRVVVTADITQIDLAGSRSGMLDLARVLSGIDGLAFVHLTGRDVVRHKIVQDIVHAYERGRSPDSGGTGPGADGEPSEIPTILGDVVVCPAVARRNAPSHAGTYDDELALLLVHGILHLLGMDHVGADEAALMERRQREL